jgi:cell division septation protein DedD
VQEPVRRDRELTLGPATLGALGVGLLALCVLCFLFGYSAGHHAAESGTASQLLAAGQPIPQQAAPQSKPSAKLVNAPPQSAAIVPDQREIADSGAAAAPSSVSVPVSSSQSTPVASPAEPAVRSALASQPATSQPASGSAAVESALAHSSGIMVQIAAVSHAEDADVLVSALRKRGYAVTSRRDPADGLLHVEVGPFANRTDAWAIRQKLLNDGYNAIVNP